MANLLLVTEEVDQVEYKFLTYLRTESSKSKSGHELLDVARKNFCTSRILKIPWIEINEDYLKSVENSLNSGRVKLIKEAIAAKKS